MLDELRGEQAGNAAVVLSVEVVEGSPVHHLVALLAAPPDHALVAVHSNPANAVLAQEIEELAAPATQVQDPIGALEQLHERYAPRGFTVLGINLDDTTGDALDFVKQYGLTYPQLREGDGADRRDAYAMTGFPESFLIDPQGDVALIRRGPVDDRYLQQNVLPQIESRR